jgi:hypothetical protein
MEISREVATPQEDTETTKNILLSKALDLLSNALDADEKREFEQAFLFYNRALEVLINLMKSKIFARLLLIQR